MSELKTTVSILSIEVGVFKLAEKEPEIKIRDVMFQSSQPLRRAVKGA
jgi:hypothetical protein